MYTDVIMDSDYDDYDNENWQRLKIDKDKINSSHCIVCYVERMVEKE